jgi:hypothetical protein
MNPACASPRRILDDLRDTAPDRPERFQAVRIVDEPGMVDGFPIGFMQRDQGIPGGIHASPGPSDPFRLFGGGADPGPVLLDEAEGLLET